MTKLHIIKHKISNLKTLDKIIFVICLCLIFISLLYISRIDTIQTFEYTKGGEIVCVETYINGIINTSYCPQNTNIFPKKPWLLYTTNLKNLTLNLTQN